MRIFIALLFQHEVKDRIYDYLEEIEEIAESGNFTTYGNLHLTVLYIGEVDTDYLQGIKRKLSEISLDKITYQTKGLDYFQKSGNKKIVYLGIKQSFELERLYQLVCLKIKELGKFIPTGSYTPHITIGREVRLISDTDLALVRTKPMTIVADRISIMQSTRVNGKLTYLELDSIPLH